MFKKHIKALSAFQLGLTLVAITSLGACSTSSVVKMTEAAPITYKIGQGAGQYASLTTPKTYRNSDRHTNLTPQRNSQANLNRPYVPPATQYSGPKFDKNMIDKELYAHQKVGQRYSINGKSYTPKHNPTYDRSGLASWYGEKFHGKPTATGEIYNMNELTAAHKTLPLNTMLHVENLENGKTLVVRLNDRGPFVDGRIIDLSKASAIALGTIEGGIARVRVRYIGPADPNTGNVPSPIPPVYEEQPRLSVEAPLHDPLAYSQPEAALPKVSQDYFDVPQSKSTELNFNPINPSAPVALPDMPSSEDDGQITLTIKGPIHIAKHDGEKPKARLIHTANK